MATRTAAKKSKSPAKPAAARKTATRSTKAKAGAKSTARKTATRSTKAKAGAKSTTRKTATRSTKAKPAAAKKPATRTRKAAK